MGSPATHSPSELSIIKPPTSHCQDQQWAILCAGQRRGFEGSAQVWRHLSPPPSTQGAAQRMSENPQNARHTSEEEEKHMVNDDNNVFLPSLKNHHQYHHHHIHLIIITREATLGPTIGVRPR